MICLLLASEFSNEECGVDLGTSLADTALRMDFNPWADRPGRREAAREEAEEGATEEDGSVSVLGGARCLEEVYVVTVTPIVGTV